MKNLTDFRKKMTVETGVDPRLTLVGSLFQID